VLVTAAIVPGPPAFVAELMGSAAHELDDLRRATDLVVSQVLSDLVRVSAGSPSPSPSLTPSPSSGSSSPGSDSVQLVVVGPGQPGEFDAAGPVSFAGFGRDVLLPSLVEGRAGDRELPTPMMVARYLASRDIVTHPGHAELWASARWITTGGGDATALGEQLGADGKAVGLILVADGAACHGAKAPRAQDPRAKAYDDAVWAALASAQPSRLAQIDAQLGDELGATGPQVWPVLVAASLGADADFAGEVLWAGAPYGVGWAVASWCRPCQ
jgi:hypothetical protein